MANQKRNPTREESKAALELQAPSGGDSFDEAKALATQRQSDGDLIVINDDILQQAIEAMAELSVSFDRYAKSDQLKAFMADATPLYITDVVTINIKDQNAKPGENPEKPVHLFRFETEDHVDYLVMLGINSVRDRIARAFNLNRLIGKRVTVGPVKINQMPTKLQPAWVFDKLPGFAMRAAV